MNAGFNLSGWAITHRSFVTYLMIVCMIGGAWAYVRLGRNEDPSFTAKAMIVQAQWPGANINDTLQQVTDRLEKTLQETPSLDFVRSYTTPGSTTIFVTLKDSTPARLVADTWYQVRKKISDMKSNLPAGVLGPGFNDEFGDTFGIVYAFTSDGFSHRELRDFVEDARSRLLHLQDVSKIDVMGAQDERLYVEFSVQQLAGLNIDPWSLIRSMQAQNAVTPAGVVQTGAEKIQLRVSGEFASEDTLRRINFVANGQIFRASDIGTLKRAYADPPQPMFRVNGEPAIGIGIAMRDGGDLLALGRDIDRTMAEITANLPIGIEPHLVADQGEIVHSAIGDFTEALWEAIAIVLGVSFLTLGVRAGGVVATSIPLVLAIVFVVMAVTGIDLQRISLGALVISLGLLVDDAMITVEAMVGKLEAGMDKVQATTFAYTSTAFPMLTGTLATIAGFVPVGFARSSAGEYTYSLFAVIAIALTASWFVAVVFAPLVGLLVLSTNVRPQQGHELGAMMRRFRTLLVAAMRARWVTIGLTLVLFAISIAGLRLVPLQFFPSSDRPELLVDLKLQQNASIYATDRAASRFEAVLKSDPDIEHWSTYVGRGAIRFYLPMNVQLANDFFSQTVVVTKSLAARERVRVRLEQAFQERFPDVVGRVYPLELGPPVGWPLQYRVSGPDADEVRDIAYKVATVMAEDPDARSINFDWMEPGRTLQIKVDQDQARLLGVSSEDLAKALNAVVSGITVTEIRDGIYLIDVVVRAIEEERVSISTLRTLQIPISGGRTVPLLQIATVGYGQEYPLMWRRDRLPTLTVQADVRPGVQPDTVVQALRNKMTALGATLPPGRHIEVGGSSEESEKAQLSVLLVVPLMLALMTTLLMIQLQSVHRLLLVLSVAPLGLIGVVAALLISGKPLGFVAILGVVALIGMIVRNSVILIDQIETEIAEGRHPWDAVIEATTHRCRPILLTAAAAILGMTPIAPSVFFGPMAYAIMGGLAVATALTLLFLPALYVAWFRVKMPA